MNKLKPKDIENLDRVYYNWNGETLQREMLNYYIELANSDYEYKTIEDITIRVFGTKN